jgi:c-di-GMP-binding flagellar brake protein YcgR
MILSAFFKKKNSASNDRRRAYRVAIKDLKATVHGKGATFTFTVKDLSASGLGLMSQAKAFKPGVMVRMDIVLGKQAVCQGLVAKVVRAGSGVVGCQFESLNKKQETVLHEMVLNEQKKQAEMRKGKGVEGEIAPADMEGSLTFVDPWSKKQAFIKPKNE